MQNMMGRIRRCAEDYNMIAEGDKIAVGVSGGKDSLTLLYLLAALRRYYPAHYELQAVTIDMGLPGMDFSPVAALCEKLEVPYQIKKTEIGPIIFDYRHEKNPCSMCAKMRRGALNDVLGEAMMRVQPPTDKGRRLKIYYMTQSSVAPPTFVLFCNDAELFHFSYQRYIENCLRTAYGFAGTPIVLVIKQRGEDPDIQVRRPGKEGNNE